MEDGVLRKEPIPSPLMGEGKGGGGASIGIDDPPFLTFPRKGGRD